MSQLHPFGLRGPCINGRTETLCESISPFGETVYFKDEKLIFDAVEFRAQPLVFSGDELLREGSELTDRGKFGDSVGEAIRDAQKWYDKLGDATRIVVIATLAKRPAFYANKKAFYAGEVMVHYAIPRWGFYWENGECVETCDLSEQTTEFEVWVNGENGKDYAEVQRLIEVIPGQDIAADRRKSKTS